MFTISTYQNNKVLLANDAPIVLIAGPCAIESKAHALEMAFALQEITKRYNMPFIYKSSFEKANRTSISSFRGVGLKEGLATLADVREKFKVPTITDVHSIEQVKPVANVVDILQIPAFLCRQTELLLSAAKTNKPLLIKKGQFLAPWEMQHVVAKIQSTGNNQIALCERGTTFGYNNLVVDMRSLDVMKKMQVPVVFDATHSVQLPGGQGVNSGGQREFVSTLARAAVAVGVAALFLEVHENPDKAPCDGANMLSLKELPYLLEQLCTLDTVAKKYT